MFLYVLFNSNETGRRHTICSLSPIYTTDLFITISLSIKRGHAETLIASCINKCRFYSRYLQQNIYVNITHSPSKYLNKETCFWNARKRGAAIGRGSRQIRWLMYVNIQGARNHSEYARVLTNLNTMPIMPLFFNIILDVYF